MAKQKTKKVYETKTGDGRITLRLVVPTVDGKDYSISAPYPYYENVGGGIMKKLSKKETEKMLFERLKCHIKVQ